MSLVVSKIIYAEVVNRFKRELERTHHLDIKANNIIGFIGILTGIVSGFGAFTLKIPTTDLEMVTLAIYGSSLIFLFLSLVFGMKAHFPQKFTIVPDPYFLIDKYGNATQQKTINDLSDNYAVAVEENLILNNSKIKNIKRSMYCLFIAILLFSIFAGFFALNPQKVTEVIL